MHGLNSIMSQLTALQAQLNTAQQAQDLGQMDTVIAQVQELINSARGISTIPTLSGVKSRIVQDLSNELTNMQQARGATATALATAAAARAAQAAARPAPIVIPQGIPGGLQLPTPTPSLANSIVSQAPSLSDSLISLVSQDEEEEPVLVIEERTGEATPSLASSVVSEQVEGRPSAVSNVVDAAQAMRDMLAAVSARLINSGFARMGADGKLERVEQKSDEDKDSLDLIASQLSTTDSTNQK